jgi:hypothetical protein
MVPSTVSGLPAVIAVRTLALAFVCLSLLGQPEIEHLCPGLRQHDVAGRQVAMDYSLLVGFIQRVGDRGSVAQHFFDRQRPTPKTIGQSFASQALHHQIVGAILGADVVQTADVGMRKLGDGTSFTLKALLQTGTRDKMPGENFDGDITVEAGIACTVDLTHAARTQRREFRRAQVSCQRLWT